MAKREKEDRRLDQLEMPWVGEKKNAYQEE